MKRNAQVICTDYNFRFYKRQAPFFLIFSLSEFSTKMPIYMGFSIHTILILIIFYDKRYVFCPVCQPFSPNPPLPSAFMGKYQIFFLSDT